MSKEVDKRECRVCDSEYKIVYDSTRTDGFAKFCPFCAEELTDPNDDDFDKVIDTDD